ncbi:hypothetical protein [Nocardia lasii]|uniref:Uncharacterized protein n=1 Tax=Nocardia lasii TaxID=1616107 RepID=A0ABW1JMB9_9NOCA
MADDIAGWWSFVMLLGAGLFIPGMVVAGLGSAMLGRGRGGAVVAIGGLALLSVVALFYGVAGFDDVLNASADSYDPRWTARLTMTGATMYAVPFLLLIVGNCVAARAVWSTRNAKELPVEVA